MTICIVSFFVFFCFKQKTAYEMRISDWSSDVCSSDLAKVASGIAGQRKELFAQARQGGEHQRIGGALGEQRQRSHQRHAGLLNQLGEVAEIGRASCRERVCQYV